MDIKNCNKLELNKILSACADLAALSETKKSLCECMPSSDLAEVRRRLAVTAECDKLLYRYGVSKIAYFDDVTDYLVRARKGSTLSCQELIDVNCLLRSTRSFYVSIQKVQDDEIVHMRKLSNDLYFDKALEEDIDEKILSAEQVSDHASERLYSIRSRIRSLNEKIRSTLSEYITGSNAQYLQDAIVTMRNDRYVIPVKAEHKNKVRGFVHDRSQSGATFFIEPEYVLELNNELMALSIDEREEVERILKALSVRVGSLSEQLEHDMHVLAEIESYLVRAEYGYGKKCILPEVNDRGYISILRGRHPLIDKDKVVPVSIELGKNYNFLLISGANTGGKTVTLKMSGLFCLMAACGLFIPAASGSQVAVFDDVFCDVGDSQSIEESLSTFSSHITTVTEICNKATAKSLVLIDELGGGTNPDEGQALAKAVVEYLLKINCRGIVTTHFTPLKEFAYTIDGIENASMEFDSNTLKPLYSIKIGLPGASNALAISRRLGLKESILEAAYGYLSEGSRTFENIVRRAEDSRVEAEEKLKQAEASEREWQAKLNEVNKKIEALDKEREKLYASARAESRRIIAERTQQANDILDEIEGIFQKEEISQSELIRARTLKNKLKNSAYSEEEKGSKVTDYQQATAQNLKVGMLVFVKPMQSDGKVVAFQQKKGEAEVQVGSLHMHLPLKDLLIIGMPQPQESKTKLKVIRSSTPTAPQLELNVLGLTVDEALIEVDQFIDRAVTDNLSVIKVIHGNGTGALKNAIAQHLKRHRNVESFRLGKYGEGESGVTIITLK